MKWLIYSLVYLGSALMVYNIYSYIRYAASLRKSEHFKEESGILNIPIFLLVSFLFGYLAVGIFGKPDLIISGILFGGSIFVFIMVFLMRRITDRIQEGERIVSKVMALEESNRVKAYVLSSVSHEMRTPLNAIIGLDTIARKNPELLPETRGQFEKIDENALHLLSLINTMLDFSQIDSGSLVLNKKPFSLSALLEDINKSAGNICAAKGLTYHPAETEGYCSCFVGDEDRIVLVLRGILDNAVKFTSAPGTVSLSAEQIHQDDEKIMIRFVVSDTGVGINEEFLPHVFDAFSREDEGATSRFSGTGLGLAFAKKLLDIMGAAISVSSEKGKGTVFMVDIPLEIGVCPQETSETEITEENGNAKLPVGTEDCPEPLNGCHVLIAEDIDINAEILADLLDMEGVSSERAENGQKAVELFSGSEPGHFDAIFMDLRMPVMDGLDATRAIRALDRADAKTIPILALTANTFDEDKLQTVKAGMNTFIAKPVDAEQLYDNLRRLIRESRNK